MPSVNQMASELKGKGLELVMIAFRENPELVRRTVKERGYTGRVLLDESGDTTGRVYGVFGPAHGVLRGPSGQPGRPARGRARLGVAGRQKVRRAAAGNEVVTHIGVAEPFAHVGFEMRVRVPVQAPPDPPAEAANGVVKPSAWRP